MLSRRSASRIGSAAASPLAASMVVQRRFDHDRWYGHALELDCGNYKFTNQLPMWQRREPRSEDQARQAAQILPHIDFASSYEAMVFDADRLNTHINRKEFGNEVRFRLEKQSNTVTRAQTLINAGSYPDEKVEDMMIARIADEEHIQAEMKYVKCIRANELAEDNRLDILPGGSPNSLREKTRWNMQMELHPIDRSEIMSRLTAWLPEKYHIVYFDDFQTVAANDAALRKEMMGIVQSVKKEHEAEANAAKMTADLDEVVGELNDDVDPTAHITSDAIKKCTSLDQLHEWSRKIHEYNGDKRIYDVYGRAAELTKNAHHAQLAKSIRQWGGTIASKA